MQAANLLYPQVGDFRNNNRKMKPLIIQVSNVLFKFPTGTCKENLNLQKNNRIREGVMYVSVWLLRDLIGIRALPFTSLQFL